MEFLSRIRRFVRVLISTWHWASEVLRNRGPDGFLSLEQRKRITYGWGTECLSILRVKIRSLGEPAKEPVLFVGNHMSYMDIPLLMTQTPTVFMAKKELSKWPIFGRAIVSVGCPLVDRDSAQSRRNASEKIAPYIQQHKTQLTIFPSGTTTLHEERPWRWGAFLIAKRYKIPIQPFRIRYKPARAAAYIDDDLFAKHLWALLGTEGIEAEVEFAEPIYEIEDAEAEAQKWWAWVREKLENPA